MRRWVTLLLAYCLASAVDRSAASAAARGVDVDTIVFGQSACFTGPNRKLGLNYRTGILAAFRERNDQGGIHGRSLELISLDDAYEPAQAAANAERFVSEDNVLAVIGGVGTPTAKRIAPVLRTAEIPFVGPFTGADFLRDSKQYPNVVNLRAGYFDETRTLVDHIVRDRAKSRLGIIYQDDAFGRSVLRNYKEALDEYDIPILAKTSFSRNTHAFHTSLFALAKADLDAILIVGAYPANSDIINLANSLGHEYIMANLSFVLSYELKQRVNAPSDRILVTEVMPNANDTDQEVVRKFQRALREEHGQQAGSVEEMINEVSLEGYILGRYVVTVLERMGNELTREQFMAQALLPEPVAIDNWRLEFEPGSNTGSHYIRLIDLGGDGFHSH